MSSLTSPGGHPAPAGRDQQVIRVFLSSTFRDFMQERDLLVKQVFPSLRRRAQERGVEVVDVDLRWGITEEQSKQGQTIGICLDEIERCRPYFIGLLGDRYGWVPEHGDYRPELLRRQNWLPPHQGNASVTELEILHGVLNNPEMAGRAFFYFRDPAYSDAKAAEGPGWRSESPEERQKLEALKERIRASGFPVVEKGVATPKAIADRIEADLWSLIEEQFPEVPKTDPLELEAARHASYRADRTGLYLGGETYIQQLQRWISAGEQRILITGESGAGKSALISNWVAAHESSQPDDVIFCHHLGSSNDASALRPLLARMIDSASTLLVDADELSEPLKVPQDWWELVSEVTNTLSRLSTWAIRHQRRWIWVLDGLDKLDLDDQQALPWLPLVMPKGVHLVVSALDCQVRTLLQERQFTELTIGPLGGAEQEQLIEKYLKLYTKQLVPDLRRKITGHRQGSSPLFLRVLLEELRLCGKFQTLAEQLQGYLTAESVADLYELVLQRLEDDGHGDAVRKVMTALWASRAGLSENELLAITGLVHAQWAPIGIGLQEALGEANGRLVFGHDFLRQAVRDRYLPTEEQRRQKHSELADWFEDLSREFQIRNAQEFSWQLAQSRNHEKLRLHICDPFNLAFLITAGDANMISQYWRLISNGNDSRFDLAIAGGISDLIEIFKHETEGQEILLTSLEPIGEILRKLGLYGNVLLAIYNACLEASYKLKSKNKIRLWIFRIANCQLSMGLPNDALTSYIRILHQYHSVNREYPSRLDIQRNMAIAYQQTGRPRKAMQILEEYLAYARNRQYENPEELISTTISIASIKADSQDFEGAKVLYEDCLSNSHFAYGDSDDYLINIYEGLGWCSQCCEDYLGAKSYYKKALAICRKHGMINGIQVVEIYKKIFSILKQTEKFSLAENLLRHCLLLAEGLFGDENCETLALAESLADFLSGQEKYDQSISLWRRLVKAKQRLETSNTNDLLHAMHRLAEDLSFCEQYEESAKICETVFKQRQELLGELHEDTLASLDAIAFCYSMQYRFGESLPWRKILLKRTASAYGQRSSEYMQALQYIATDCAHGEDINSSKTYRLELLEIQASSLGWSHVDTLLTACDLADLHMICNEPNKAAALSNHCLESLSENVDSSESDKMNLINRLADALSKQGRHAEAIPLRRRELAWCRQQDGDTDPGTLTSINGLAIDLREIGELEEAERLFRELVGIRQQVMEPGDFDIGFALGGLAKTLETAGKLEEALKAYKQALDHHLEHQGTDDWHTNRKRLELARLLHKLGGLEEARRQLDQLEGSMGSIPDPDDDDRALLADAAALRELLDPSS